MKVAQALAWLGRPEDMVRTRESYFHLDINMHITFT